jgi:hypothetical protein
MAETSSGVWGRYRIIFVYPFRVARYA